MTAILPPLMLVNSESRAVASAHCRRAFRNCGGKHGVLAGYPTVLCVKDGVLELLQPDDLDLVEEFILEGDDNEFSMNPVHCRDQWAMVFSAPNLKSIVVRVEGFSSAQAPLFCRMLRDLFVETAESYPNLRVPEVVLKLSDCVPLGSTKEPYRF